MDGKRCFFIGHREAPRQVYEYLREAVETHIVEYGVREFIVGHYGGFDRIAAEAVIDAKKTHPKASLLLLLPYHPAERPIKKPDGFDCTFHPEGMESVPRSFAIVRANKYMVNHVDYLIAYAWQPGSNAQNLVEYARRRERKGAIAVQNLADDMEDVLQHRQLC